MCGGASPPSRHPEPRDGQCHQPGAAQAGEGAGPAPPRVVRAGRFKSGGGGEAAVLEEPSAGDGLRRGASRAGSGSGAGPPGAAPRRFVCPARTKTAPRRHPGEHERAKPLGTGIPENQPRLGALPAPPGSSLPREGIWIRVCLGGCGQIDP